MNTQLMRRHDSAYPDFDSALAALDYRQRNTTTVNLDSKDLRLTTDGADLLLNERPLTNWSFRQLCTIAKAPVELISSVSTDTATRVLNERIAMRTDTTKHSVLIGNTVRAITSQTYQRVWDRQMLGAVANAVHGTAVKPYKVFVGERDAFVCLVNKTPIYEKDADKLSRGMFVWNSEVGARTFGIARFLFRSICSNCMIFGMKMDTIIRRRHTGDMAQISERIPEFVAWCDTPMNDETARIERARAKVLNPESILDTLFVNFNVTRSDGMRIVEYAKVDERISREYGDTTAQWNTVWGVMQGVTRYSQTLPYANDRVTFDLIGNRLFELQ